MHPQSPWMESLLLPEPEVRGETFKMACSMLCVKAGVPSPFFGTTISLPTPDPTPGPMVPTFSGFKLHSPISQCPLYQTSSIVSASIMNWEVAAFGVHVHPVEASSSQLGLWCQLLHILVAPQAFLIAQSVKSLPAKQGGLGSIPVI